MKTQGVLRNGLGAFADGAVLFPLIALLTTRSGFDSVTVLATTGIAYVASAFFFRVPMAVQPLKSIAVAALAVGGTVAEIRWSGALLGAGCVGLLFLPVERLARQVPVVVVHQLQVGLGVLLILQGATAAGGWDALLQSGPGILTLCAVAWMVFFPEVRGVPLLGVVATLGLVWSIVRGGALPTSPVAPHPVSEMRPWLVVQLLVPQIVLTLGNSVVATQNVCRRYFGDHAWRVTVRRLLVSIGLGNLVVAAVGGMPFCHGSGGVTAHYRGGSTRASSTAFFGAVLLTLAGVQFYFHAGSWTYPPALVGVLLLAVGIFHLGLGSESLRTERGDWVWSLVKLMSAASTTLATRNLIWVLGAALVLEVASHSFAALGVRRDPLS